MFYLELLTLQRGIFYYFILNKEITEFYKNKCLVSYVRISFFPGVYVLASAINQLCEDFSGKFSWPPQIDLTVFLQSVTSSLMI